MRVIFKKTINKFINKYPQSKNLMLTWHKIASAVLAQNFSELKSKFRTVDKVNKYVVFDIGGNKYRLIAHINFNKQILFIRRIWTHLEYDNPMNQKDLVNGKL